MQFKGYTKSVTMNVAMDDCIAEVLHPTLGRSTQTQNFTFHNKIPSIEHFLGTNLTFDGVYTNLSLILILANCYDTRPSIQHLKLNNCCTLKPVIYSNSK